MTQWRYAGATVVVHPDAATWLSLTAAAEHLGLSRHQLRRRIKAGQLASRQVVGPHGPAYEVCVDPDATVASTARNGDDRHGSATVTVTPPLTEVVSLLRDTQAQLLQATAAASMWQTRAQHLGEQLEQAQRALPGPTPQERPISSDSEGPVVEMTQQASSSPPRARPPWWRLWR